MTEEWITDRQPTEVDGDTEEGDVRIRRAPDRDTCWSWTHWSYVGAGVPWKHSLCWTPPPAEDPPAEPAEPEPEPVKTRGFLSFHRTFKNEYFQMDVAVATDHTAWVKFSESAGSWQGDWVQVDPLPQPGEE